MDFAFKKIVLSKSHKNHQQFFSLKEDYFLLISEYVFCFPEFGYRNLTHLLRDIAIRTERTLKSVQRRREKLLKLSKSQINVLRQYIINFFEVIHERKILNLKYEDINIIKVDNTDLPQTEKKFILDVIQRYEDEQNEFEKIERER